MLKELKPFEPRRFVPVDADLTSKDQVVAFYQRLLGRAVTSKEEFEAWILDGSELGAALSQAGSVLYIEMTCQTDDADRVKAYQEFIQTVEPAVKSLGHALNKKYLELYAEFPLPAERYDVYTRAAEVEVKLFVEANVALETEVAMLSQEYQAVTGAMTVDFDGKERTLPEMSKYLLDPDRDLRERAWRATAARRLKDKDKLEGLFEKMRTLRRQIAHNAGFDNFRDYQFKAYHRFDYAPADCKAYHAAVREVVAPLACEISEHRRKVMGLPTLRPWDTAVDPLNRAPLKPFDKADELIAGVGRIFDTLDPELAGLYADMRAHGLLDLASRKGKAPGGYQNTLNEARKPFIFMNAVGLDDDVRTLLHESGHAMHAYLCAHDPLVEYRHAPMEFCEVASMSMELMADHLMTIFYNTDDAKRSTLEHWEGVVSILPWVAIVDAFQHWIYEHPAHAPQERAAEWVRLNEIYSAGGVDWTGLEEERAYLWHRQLHIFEVPFYYIEYAIAQLGALQIWQQVKKDPAKAIANYKNGLALGGSRSLPELFAAAGICFDFTKGMIGPLMNDVAAEWRRLAQ